MRAALATDLEVVHDGGGGTGGSVRSFRRAAAGPGEGARRRREAVLRRGEGRVRRPIARPAGVRDSDLRGDRHRRRRRREDGHGGEDAVPGCVDGEVPQLAGRQGSSAAAGEAAAQVSGDARIVSRLSKSKS